MPDYLGDDMRKVKKGGNDDGEEVEKEIRSKLMTNNNLII